MDLKEAVSTIFTSTSSALLSFMSLPLFLGSVLSQEFTYILSFTILGEFIAIVSSLSTSYLSEHLTAYGFYWQSNGSQAMPLCTMTY